MTADQRIRIALVVSALAHAAALSVPIVRKPPEPVIGSAPTIPLTVRLVEAEKAAPAPEVVAEAPAPVVVPKPPPVTPPAHKAPQPLPQPPKPAEPVPEAPPAPVPAPPAVDMLAMINARREKRRALEAAAARQQGMARETAPEEEAISRNLQTLSGREGVSGVFEVLRKGTRTAEYAFNGWRPESQRKWREVIEVDAGQGGDVERAIVRSMIALIRSHYQGDFNWESHRLGRVIVLSARPEDNEGLEDFLMREFFGTPTLNRAR